MNIFVTGATGFIGENVVNVYLEQGHKVHVLVRFSSDSSHLSQDIGLFVFTGDVLMLSNYMKKNKIDVVVHLASCFIVDHNLKQLDDLIDSNVKFGTQLLEAMVISNVKYFINTATSWQYFDSSSDEYHPTNLYAATKQAFEMIIKYYVDVYDLKVITLVIFDTYGPKDRRGKLISMLEKIAKKQINLSMSKGEQEIGLVYIDDITRGYVQSLQEVQETVGHKKYTLYPKEVFTLKEVVAIFEGQTKLTLNVNWGERNYRKREVMKVWTKGVQLPNWCAKIELKEGLTKLLKSEICE